jgi:integrase/recombinase XerD
MVSNDDIQDFLTDCKSRNLSPQTLVLNKGVLSAFLNFCEDSSTTPTRIKEFLAAKSASTSKATARRYYTVLQSFFKYTYNEGLIDENPMETVSPPKAPTPLIEPLTAKELASMLNLPTENRFIPSRDKLIIYILIDCGLRVSELINLKLSDVGDSYLIIRHGKGDKARQVPFGDTTGKHLRRYLARRGELRSDLLIVNSFGELTRRENIHRIIEFAAKGVGITRHVYPHLLRHSFATQFLREGGDVFALQRMLGHSSLAMTRRYVELADEDIANQHRRYSPADRLSKSTRKRL